MNGASILSELCTASTISYRLELLGSPRLQSHENALTLGAKAWALLGFLALSPNLSASRNQVAALLWARSADPKASLRQCLKELRSSFRDSGGKSVLRTDNHSVGLEPDLINIDILEIRKNIQNSTFESLNNIMIMYKGEVLEGLGLDEPEFNVWLSGVRNELRTLIIDKLNDVLVQSIQSKRTDNALWLAKCILRIDPLVETAHQSVIKIHLSKGDLASARQQLDHCRLVFRNALDVEPSTETQQLITSYETRSSTVSQPDNIARADPSKSTSPLISSEGRDQVVVTILPEVSLSNSSVDSTIIGELRLGLSHALARIRRFAVVDVQSEPVTNQHSPYYAIRIGLIKAANRIRVTASLSRHPNGQILWAEHSDHDFSTDRLSLSDDMVARLCHRLDQEVQFAEIMRVRRVRTGERTPYELTLQAIPLIFRTDRESLTKAGQLLSEAQQLDPEDVLVLSWRAFWYFLYIGQGFVDDTKTARSELDWLISKSIELDPMDSFAHAVAGHVKSFIDHDYDAALNRFEDALIVDPRNAYVIDLRALTNCYLGQSKIAVEQLASARDMISSSRYRYFFRMTECLARFLSQDYKSAAEIGRSVIRENPSFHAAYRPLIASLAQLGQVDEARKYLADLLVFEPDFSIEWFRTNYPPLQQDDLEHYLASLKLAGTPKS